MCTCGLSLSYLSWENMQIWNIRFPAFMAPYKLAELQRLRRPETRVKLLFFVNSRLLLPKKSSKLEMYLILSTFSIKYTLKVWLDVRVSLEFVLSVPSLHCMYSQLWGVIGEMVPKNVVPWNVYVFGPFVRITDRLSVVCETLLGLWNFVQLKCLVFHAWEMFFKLKSHF